MTTPVKSEIIRMAIKHAIELLSDITTTMQGKDFDTWKSDSDRSVTMEKLTIVISYFTITKLFDDYADLKPIMFLSTEKDDKYVFLYLTQILPINIRFLENLLS